MNPAIPQFDKNYSIAATITIKNLRLSALSLCRSPFILLWGNLIHNLLYMYMLPTKFRFIWLSSFKGEDF